MKYLTIITSLIVANSSFAENSISETQKQFLKKYKTHKKIVPPDQALINTDQEPDLSTGFTPLYNGKDLEGWTSKGGTCTFEAQGEIIVGTCVKGSPSTYLVTDKSDYTDFIFTAEIKWEVDGNTGIMFRAQSKPGKKYETVFGPQVEMEGFGFMKGTRGWSGGIYGQACGGWIYPLWLKAHDEARKSLKPDGWNRVTIHATGTKVKTWVNGIPATHWSNDKYLKGNFGLQVHSGKKGTIHFKNIKVKELPKTSE